MKVFDMGESTSTNWPAEPFSLNAMEEAFRKMMEVDFPKEIRCSAAYLDAVKRSTLFAPAVVDPLMPPGVFRFDGLPINVDHKMTGMRAECHWRSGKVDDITPNYGLLDRCKGRDESKEQNS